MLKNLLIALLAAASALNLVAAEHKELEAAKREYEKSAPQGNEAARLQYVNRLAGILDGFVNEYRKTGVHKDDQYVAAINAELKLHPTPKDSPSAKLSANIIGKWKSPRHEYLYRRDGTYAMLPLEKGTPSGHWRIESNQYIDTTIADDSKGQRYTIILLNARYFIYFDKDNVFFESRFKK